MQLQDKTILITGGARVGQFVAEELLGVGVRLAMTYMKEASEAHAKAKPYQANFMEEAQVRKLLADVQTDFGQIDGLINMVSIFTEDPAFAEASAGKSGDHFDLQFMQKVFAINAFGNMLAARLFAEAAKARGASGAPIISFIDWAVDHPYADYDIYMASKAALRHYLMALQTTFSGFIRVVNIHPGMILEPPGFLPEVKQSIMNNTPTKNIGTPEQAAKLVKDALELDFLADNIYLAGGQQWRHRLRD